MNKRRKKRILAMCKRTREKYRTARYDKGVEGYVSPHGNRVNDTAVCEFCLDAEYLVYGCHNCKARRAFGRNCAFVLEDAVSQERHRPIYRALDRIERWVEAQ